MRAAGGGGHGWEEWSFHRGDRRRGRAVWLRDANSTNGTWLNGRRLTGDREQELHHRDTLEFDPIRVRYHDPARTPADAGTRLAHRSRPGVSYGDVPAVGRGLSRFLMILGLLMSLAGFAIWMFVIFRNFTAITDASGPDFGPPTDFLGPPVLDGVPLGVAGFALIGWEGWST